MLKSLSDQFADTSYAVCPVYPVRPNDDKNLSNAGKKNISFDYL
jgi:hypothetical protein